LTIMVKHKTNKARKVFREKFGETPLKTGTVRWYIMIEMAAQVDRIGLERIIKEYVDVCVAKKYSVNSANELKTMMADPVTLAYTMIELAALSDVGEPFCRATYTLEGDAPLVFVAYEVLQELVGYVDGSSKFTYQRLHLAAKKAEDTMKAQQQPLYDDFEAAKSAVEECQKKVNSASKTEASIRPKFNKRGKTAATAQVERHTEAKDELNKAEQAKEKAEKALKRVEKEKDQLVSLEKLTAHGRSVVQPGLVSLSTRACLHPVSLFGPWSPLQEYL
jgi:hypothetical protein